MAFRTLLMTMAVCGLVFYGCAKKPKQPVQQSAPAAVPSVPEPATAQPAAPKKPDTADVFNEYYNDSKSKKVDRTFSMNADASYTPEFSESGRYAVQIAAGPSSDGAEVLANAFRAKGYPAYVAVVQNPTPELSGTYYRVRIGSFSTLADAKAFGENILMPANYDYWVDLKSNDQVGTGSAYGAGTGGTDYSSGASSYTPSYTPATTEPAYTPSTTTEYGSSSPSSTSTYDWSTPSTTPSTETAPASSYEPPASTTPSTDTGTGSWGGSSWR